MKNIAIIPARSGSKGLKDKNIKLLNGKPLLVYSIEAAQNSDIYDEIFVSTDSEHYANIAQQNGAKVPFLRSQDLASDTASSWDVVKDAIKKYSALGKEFETVTLLQPTSPLRTAEDIKAGYMEFLNRDADFVVSVCEVDHSPLWCNILPEDNSMVNFLNKDIINYQRQMMPTFYRISGALYIIKTDFLFNTEDYYSEKSYAIILPKIHSVDIDDELDFTIAESIYANMRL
jgi:CMP-N,N'-diacetyllegionaminic acid synthase